MTAQLAARLVTILAALGLLGTGIAYVRSLQRTAAKVPALTAELGQVRENFNAYRENVTQELTRVNSIAQGYTDEIESLRAAAARHPVTVRVRQCPPTPATAAGHPPAAPGVDAPPAAAGRVPGAGAADREQGSREVDIGPDIAALALMGEEAAATARGLQRYVESLPKQCMIGDSDGT